ncbi:MAG: DNA polymerase III subunit delta [Bacteroidetes bacterium]|nr:DNA polymerase III subunit delta [Bacteroidota bacterium]
MRFSDIPGNQSVKQSLISSVQSGRVSHAQLFLGDDGSAALPLAWAYAQYLACQNKEAEDACGTCSSCLKYKKLAHPDLHWVFPVTTGKTTHPVSDHFITEFREAVLENPYFSENQWYAHLGVENKQGFVSVKEATELTKKMALKPYEGGYKVVIIWHAEKMHTATANKLLKLLEEPPLKTLFILIAPQKEQLLTTILSRVQATQINVLSDEEMQEFLISEKKADASAAYQTTHLAEGNINEAIRLLDGDEALEENTALFQNWMRLCYQADILGLTRWIEKTSKVGRENQKSFLKYALHMVRESLVHNFASNDLQRLRGEEQAFANKFSPFIHENNAVELMNELEQAHHHIGRNASAKILLMDLSLKVVLLLRLKSLNLQLT